MWMLMSFRWAGGTVECVRGGLNAVPASGRRRMQRTLMWGCLVAWNVA